ncbi:TetR/AcrR family transcriptional regulator [Cellulomonas humilata]|uniref:TetR/AcrR family transcriptional regulator n=1 Tax=Cellulomonas humilata TaxID=144055 RepID=A0A7Y6A189_9CELL|nr:TetR/AcrR family transcriptional regulator [Cellulomonas humilata]NUU17821.1 TetR/AcrR family transcriptional regulator [Cellulomonas humilata]
MPTPSRTSNRGPAAAPENRRAILDAARRVFADRGYHAPLSAIAQSAGVGQGVLYRHFPSRLDLAFAVFEEHLAELEAIAALPDDDAFLRLWSRVVELTVEESAFVEMFLDARRTLPETDIGERLPASVAATLPRAQAAGLVNARLTVADVILVQRMVYGVVATSLDAGQAKESVHRALALLRPLLGPE